MITFVLRNGAEFSTISRLSGSAFTLGDESFGMQKNYSDKSNNPGSEEIGQRRVESTTIVIRGDWAATTDLEFTQSLNPLIAAFHETIYIKDTETNRILQVAPKEATVDHDKGAFRRSGSFNLSFERMSPAWEDILTSTATFTIPGSGVTYDTISIGDAETRVRIEIIPDTLALTEVEIVSMTPGQNGFPDRVLGVLSLVNEGAEICPANRGIVVDNINGLCYTSPKTGTTVTDENRIDIREFIKPGTSFFKNSNGENGFSITTNVDCRANFEWKNRGLT